jgi:hypothetical protein
MPFYIDFIRIFTDTLLCLKGIGKWFRVVRTTHPPCKFELLCCLVKHRYFMSAVRKYVYNLLLLLG